VVTNKALTSVGEDLAMLFEVGAIGRLTDVELLARFLDGRGDSASEAAFATIVERHGPMVLGVCRRVLRDDHAAADAFQATFLILARKARSVRVGDSLGRWLYGVSIRVARRAKSIVLTERGRARCLDDHDPPDVSASQDPCELAELRAVIDEEVVRLPSRYRSAVVLCCLEGLTQEQAARRLRCPVGTVQSRLHRAKERLRSRLTRRGLAPAIGGLEMLAVTTSRAEVPPGLFATTIAVAARLAAGRALAGTVPSLVTTLINTSIRSMLLRTSFWTGLVLAGVGLSATGFRLLARGEDEKPQVSAPRSTAQVPKAPATSPAPPIAEQLARILAEYHALQDRATEEISKTKTEFEGWKLYWKVAPDEQDFARRMVELAATSPGEPAARDALLWVINKPASGRDAGPDGEYFARAVGLLLSHHADDPEVARTGLVLHNVFSRRRDAFLEGLYARAKSRETKGLARLAFAQYLEQKVKMVKSERILKDSGTPKKVSVETYDDNGKLVQKEVNFSDDERAYDVHLRLCDPDAMQKEVEELYEEVIRDYGDVPYITRMHRELEALMREPEPKWGGKPLTAEERKRIEQLLARKQTLAEIAKGQLDAIHNLVIGKPAPEINGVDFDGKPLKLSDYRGKVVALVFWGSWCGPCMREVPHERELAERFKGRPFALLGVNCDGDKQAAVKAIADERITWPNWHDGEPGEGPIVKRYHIRGYPTIMVLDGNGIIRNPRTLGPWLDKEVEDLVKELEAAKLAK
jgi:RNA polymerase sigma factor (sigma-70 family)